MFSAKRAMPLQDGVFYLQKFDFIIKHRSGQTNNVADALSRRRTIMTVLRTTVTAFDTIKDTYKEDEDFGEL